MKIVEFHLMARTTPLPRVAWPSEAPPCSPQVCPRWGAPTPGASLAFHLLLTILSIVWAVPAVAQTSNARGKISRNFYRIPYASGDNIHVTHEYVDHGNSPAGDTGPMDMHDTTATGRAIVAAAAGEVIGVGDSLNGCGCNSAYGPCANFVQIRHANGEISTYLHIRQNSATNAGIAENVNVSQGQTIGIEGEVGWTCGDDGNPRTSSCVPSVPPGTTKCGLHVHWVVSRESTGERVNPMTCGIGNNIYVNDSDYTSAACSTNGCLTDRVMPVIAYSGFGTFRVFQADNSITSSVFGVSNFASVVFHAGNNVRMTPGFHATGPGYFRAEIGACNTTAFAPPALTAAAGPEFTGPLWDFTEDASGN